MIECQPDRRRGDRGGDNNIYFLGDESPLVYNSPCGVASGWDPARGEVSQTVDLTETIRQLADHRITVVPHCGGRRCNFDFYDPAVMPFMEIHSCHQSYEHVAREAIRQGLRIGFVGGSDDHRGAIGDSHLAARERFFSSHNGLVGVYAGALNRESLWEAFFARRVYATNGPRIVLKVTIDDCLMGGQLTAAAGDSRTISVHTVLDGLLDRIDLLVDGQLTESQ